MNSYLLNVENYDLEKEVQEKIDYVYFYGIDTNNKEELDKELKIFKKYNLEGTIFLLEELVKKADRMGFRASVGGYLANTITAYILGLTNMDITTLTKRRNLEDDIKRYGFDYQINIPEVALNNLRDYMRRFMKQEVLYQKSTYMIDKNMKKRGLVPNTYYVIPNNINILDFTALDYEINKPKNIVTCVVDGKDMKMFASIYFRCSFKEDVLYKVQKETNMNINCIPFNEKKVIKALINKKKQKYLSSQHCFLQEHYLPELSLEIDNDKIGTIEELIDLKNMTQKDWISKVSESYYLNYYKVHYPEEFYPIYLQELIDNFAKKEIVTEKLINDIRKAIKKGSINDLINKEEDAVKSIIMEIIKRMIESKINFKICK